MSKGSPSLDELVKILSVRVPHLLGSISAIALGAGLMLDDHKDLGKLGNEREPPRPHHWMWGAVLLVAGVVGAGLTALDILRELGFKPTPELVERLKEPKSTLEGLAPEILEALR